MASDDDENELSNIKQFFPLQDIESVVLLFKEQLKYGDPNLALLSLVTGYIEHKLTDKMSHASAGGAKTSFPASLSLHHEVFPCLNWDAFKNMYERYKSLTEEKLHPIRIDTEDKFQQHTEENFKKQTTSDRQRVKEIADFVWSHLSTSYFRDRPHIQSVYSFLTGKRLDCFGVALLVIATAQHLGCHDIHLALSEDHAWVTFGENSTETAEVTWHGKRDAVKRGSPVNQDSLVGFSKDWLYLGGQGINCDRSIEVAAIVSSLNPGINSKTDSETLGRLQQELLWLLFNLGHLDRFPMAICNLADLEEIEQRHSSPSIEDLYEKAIAIAEFVYSGYHVYPYTYYGGYLFRKGMFTKATEMWSNAAKTAARYTHSREDEELYKDLHEIANTFFPMIVKLCKTASEESQKLYFETEENFKNIVNFYDGVCLWEEDGCTAAVHSEWAKNFVKILSCFSPEIRSSFLMQTTPKEESCDKQNNLFFKSQKMNLLVSVLGEKKINAQAVNLHLASQVGLASLGSQQSTKRYSDFVCSHEETPKRSKRHTFLK